MNKRNIFRRLYRVAFIMLAGAMFSAPSYAFTTSLTIKQLSDFLNAYRNSNDPNKKLLWGDLQTKLAQSGASLSGDNLVFSGSGAGGTTSILNCDQIATATDLGLGVFSSPVPSSVDTNAVPWSATILGSQTGFALDVSQKRIVFDVRASGSVDVPSATGNINWSTGTWVPYWGGHDECVTFLGKDYCTWVPDLLPSLRSVCGIVVQEGFTGHVSGDMWATINTSLDVSVDPVTDPITGLVINYQLTIGNAPQVTADGGVSAFRAYISNSVTLEVFNVITSLFHDDIQNYLSKEVKKSVAGAAAGLTTKLPYSYTLPAIDPALLKSLSTVLNLPYLQDYIEQNAQQILLYMLIGDQQGLLDMFASDAACSAVSGFRAGSGIKPLPVYTVANGSCVTADPEGADTGNYFADSTCTASIDFEPSTMKAWCAEVLGTSAKSLLGNAAAWTADANPELVPGYRSRKWTVAQSTQMTMGSEPIAGNTTPFMKRVDYRDVQGNPDLSVPGAPVPVGTCQLEMRIYKKDVNATNLLPLMAIHGGSWTYRGGAFVGLESEISHYTDQGFVVFVPFYRLASNLDGNLECQRAAWTDETSDVEAALTWVQQNGAAYGAKPGKIGLMGQSAGAHLAGWLVTHRPNDVDRALLLYPPVDVRDFLSNINGAYAAYQPSLDLLATYYGVSVADLKNVNTGNPPAFVAQNSFRDLVANANGQMPPVYLIHGRADTLIPSNQSVILCNAYGGNAVDNGGGPALRASYFCGPKSRMDLFEEANHALDVCLTTRVNGMCLAGSEQSRVLVADSLKTARNWLKGVDIPALIPLISLLLN